MINVRFLGRLLAVALLLASPNAFATDSDGDGVPDESDALPCDPTASAIAYVPGKNAHGMLLFENRWPSNGDLDFNDLALAYNYVFLINGSGKVTSLQLTLNALANGAGTDSGLWLHLPLPANAASSITRNLDDGTKVTLAPATGEPDLVIGLVDNTRTLFKTPTGLINTMSAEVASGIHPMNVLIRFAQPVTLDVSVAPFDIYIQLLTGPAGHQIHQSKYPGTATMDTTLFGTLDDGSTSTRHFVNKTGLPFVLNIPDTVAWPLERVSIEHVYPDIIAFAASGGTTHTDYYDTNEDLAWAWTGGANNTNPPIPTIIGPVFPNVVTTCVAWRGTVQFGGASNLWVLGSAPMPDGDVLTAGEIYMEATNQWDGFLARFDSTNTQLWFKTFGDPVRSDYARAVATDAAGNAYVTGVTSGAFAGQSNHGGADAFVAKFDPSGNLVWNRQLGSNTWQEGWSITSDAEGNTAVAGYTTGAPWGTNALGLPQAFVLTLNPSGTLVWARQYSLNAVMSVATGIARDAAGNYLISAVRHDGVIYHGATAKVGPTGTLLWTTAAALGSGDIIKWSQGVSTDATGAAFSTGYVERDPVCHNVSTTYCYTKKRCYTEVTQQCDQIFDAFAEKTSSAGTLSWDRRLTPTPETGNPYAYAVGQAVTSDGSGGIYVGGGVWGTLSGQTLKGSYDYFLARWNASGMLAWVVQDGSSDYDYGSAVCIDPSGNPFISGYATSKLPDSVGSGHGFVAHYTSAGVRQ